jgi:hypothetical protein
MCLLRNITSIRRHSFFSPLSVFDYLTNYKLSESNIRQFLLISRKKELNRQENFKSMEILNLVFRYEGATIIYLFQTLFITKIKSN